MSAQTPPRPLDGLMILVIDDHRDTVDMLGEYLHDVGATVIGADSAGAGLAFAETHVLDVVLEVGRRDRDVLAQALQRSRPVHVAPPFARFTASWGVAAPG